MEIKELLSGANPYAAMINATKPLVKKWAQSGLLENLKTDNEKANMAILLENQAKQLVTEASSTGTAANAEQWNGIALPLVRRVFGEIVAKEFVSVQPMNLPSGLVFFLDFKYSGPSQPGFTYGTSLFGGSSSASFGRTDSPENGLYGVGRYVYSMNELNANVVVTTASVSFADVNYDTRYTTITSSYTAVTFNSSSLSNLDVAAIRSFVPVKSGSAGPTVESWLPAFTRLNAAAGTITMLVSGSVQAVGNQGYKVYYTKQPTDSSRGDFEDTASNPSGSVVIPGSDFSAGIPELELQLRSEPIVAKTRKLKAQWTPEFAQDLNAYQNIDAEAELTSMLSEYISMETDLEILDMLLVNAATTDQWSATLNEFWNGSTWTTGTVTAVGYTQGTWFGTIGTKLAKISNKIHQLTMRGGANFMVVSPDVATILEAIPGFSSDNDSQGKLKYAMGVQKAGMINNRWTVYKNPYMSANQVLMGYKGSQFLETGAVFCPYVPLMMTPLVYDSVNLTPRRGIMTRYAKKVVRPEFYGKLYVKDIASV